MNECAVELGQQWGDTEASWAEERDLKKRLATTGRCRWDMGEAFQPAGEGNYSWDSLRCILFQLTSMRSCSSPFFAILTPWSSWMDLRAHSSYSIRSMSFSPRSNTLRCHVPLSFSPNPSQRSDALVRARVTIDAWPSAVARSGCWTWYRTSGALVVVESADDASALSIAVEAAVWSSEDEAVLVDEDEELADDEDAPADATALVAGACCPAAAARGATRSGPCGMRTSGSAMMRNGRESFVDMGARGECWSCREEVERESCS